MFQNHKQNTIRQSPIRQNNPEHNTRKPPPLLFHAAHLPLPTRQQRLRFPHQQANINAAILEGLSESPNPLASQDP